MAKLDPSILNELIAGYLGPRARWRRMSGGAVSPMNVAIGEAARELQREVVVYWVDGGLPENFSLPEIDPAPIVFSTRFIEMQATLLRLLRATELSPELLSAAAEATSLQVAAAIVLQGGDPATACYLMMRSQVAARGTWIVPSTISALELEDKKESYMAVWFYALLHEIGHVYAAEQAPDIAVGQALQEEIQEAISEFSFPTELVEQLSSWLGARRLLHSLHPDQIRTEITADLFAVHILCQATMAVMGRDGRGAKFSLGKLAMCVYEIFNVLAGMNNCALVARVAAFLADPRDEPWVNVSYRIRLKHVLRYLAFLLAGEEDSGAVDAWYSRLVEATGRYADTLAAIESGQALAMRQVLYQAERDADLAGPFLKESERAPYFPGLREFIATADALGVTHPDIEFLRRHMERSSQKEPQYAFHTLWAAAPDGIRNPFCLGTRHGNLIFAFAARDDLYAYFRDESTAALPAEARIEEVVILADHAWQVPIICTQAMPQDDRRQTHVILEGTPLFDNMMRELSDGSIWSDPA